MALAGVGTQLLWDIPTTPAASTIALYFRYVSHMYLFVCLVSSFLN